MMKPLMTLTALGTVVAFLATDANACHKKKHCCPEPVVCCDSTATHAPAPTPAPAPAPAPTTGSTPAREQYSSAFNAPPQTPATSSSARESVPVESYGQPVYQGGVVNQMERSRRSIKSQW